MDFKGQHILSTEQFDKDSLLALFEVAKEMEVVMESGGGDLLKGKVMASVFFEPSTRTRFSFEAAMQRLGGAVISNADMMSTSSIKKMETLEDTGKVLAQLADVLVVRHPEAGAVNKIATNSDVPVLNAGDGPAQHPTQGLLDLYTIWKEFGKIDGLTVGLIGDLKHSRVLHSEFDLLQYFDVEFVLVSPASLRLPQAVEGGDWNETEDIASVIERLDVISFNRLQKERFENPEECEALRGSFVLTTDLMAKAKEKSIVLNPLPRIDEIDVAVDADPRAKYFEQVKNGVAVRMALLKLVFGL